MSARANPAGSQPPLPDGSFARTDLAVAVAPLVEVIRSFRPHVMTTYNESDGGHTWINWRRYLADFAPRLFR